MRPPGHRGRRRRDCSHGAPHADALDPFVSFALVELSEPVDPPRRLALPGLQALNLKYPGLRWVGEVMGLSPLAVHGPEPQPDDPARGCYGGSYSPLPPR